MDRRGFLKVTGIVGGGLTLNWFDQELDFSNAFAQGGARPPDNPLVFVTLNSDNTANIVINRLEFGQGVNTSLAMLVAEELDMPMSQLTSSLAPNNPAYNDPLVGMQLTGGSGSIAHSWNQYRTIGATMRALFVKAAALRWKTDEKNVRTSNGTVIFGKNKLTYVSLADDVTKLTAPTKVTLKASKDHKLIGKPQRRLDSGDISTGNKKYGIDFNAPTVALVARPPGFDGRKPVRFDAEKAKAIKGVLAVFETPTDRGGTGVAVLAKGYWQAKMGRDALDIVWSESKSQETSSDKLFEQYKLDAQSPKVSVVPFPKGVSDADLKSAKKTITAEYSFPYLAHAAMEPLNCTVLVTDTSCEITGATQMPGIEAMVASKITGLQPTQVKVTVLPAGGGFGRRAVPTSDFVSEAVHIGKKWKELGNPGAVKVMWSREDDMKGGYYRPMHVHRAEIGLDDNGQVLAWKHAIVGQSIVKGTPFEAFLFKNGFDGTMTEGVSENQYNLPLQLGVTHPEVNVPVLWWRSVGHTHTAFVMETLIDELASAAKKDPVAFRLERLDKKKHSRSRAALELAVSKSGYGKKQLPKGHAWGVAVHESFNTAVAYVVEVSVKEETPIVQTVYAGVHCNKVVNPLTASHQIEGALIFGLGTTFAGQAITLKNGVVEQSQFTDFRVPRQGEVPTKIHVHFVPSEADPTGLGEPGTPPIAPAIANALAALTGKRLRTLPFDLKA